MTTKSAAKANAKNTKTAAKGKSKDDDEAYTQKGKKQAKGAGDENKVKRPTSAYFYYCNDRREAMRKEQPGLSMTDQTKAMSEEWKNLDAKKRKKYDDLAAKDKERYENEKAAAPSTSGKKKTTTNNNDGENTLKRPLSAYFIFQEERRETIKKDKPQLSHKE